MKIITLLLFIASIGIAEANNIYKCPGKIEGQYTYQARPCKGAKPDEHMVKILSTGEKKTADTDGKSTTEPADTKETTEQTPETKTDANKADTTQTATPPAPNNTESSNPNIVNTTSPLPTKTEPVDTHKTAPTPTR